MTFFFDSTKNKNQMQELSNVGNLKSKDLLTLRVQAEYKRVHELEQTVQYSPKSCLKR